MDRSLLSLRATLVFLLAALAGGVAGLLAVSAGEGIARGVLCGLAAVGVAVPFFDRLIAVESDAEQVRGQAESGDRRG
ncbi:hypothetical protein ABT143_17335 [Streptomyces sp. NPDC002033]|uniref:hypothetical protein n=1 Tax=unclassified Streptomyces TaxID=2593676 RepID=UPI0033172747